MNLNLAGIAGAIFDLDGTLLNTLADIDSAANSVLAQHGLPSHPISAYREFVGEGVRVLMHRALPPENRDGKTLEACLETMQVEYPRHLNRTAAPYAGIPEILSALRGRSLRLAVLSNKPDEFTSRCISDFFGDQLFDPVLGLHPDRPRKPDPAGALEIARRWNVSPERIIYLGDSGTDMETAVRAGMLPIGVLWGYRCAKELLGAGAKHLLRHPNELLG
jgi:phosphoglycolate phosphatase